MDALPHMDPLLADAGLGDVVERVNRNTTSILEGLEVLRGVADSYAKALPASQQDRADLHQLVDGLRRHVDTLATSSSAAAKALATLTTRQPRAASGSVPAITTVVTTAQVDVPLTWPTPWPDTSYTVLAVIEPPAALLGKASIPVKSKSTTGVVLTVTASAVIAAGAVAVRAASFA